MITSVVVTAGSGFAFKELKQIDWSPCGTANGDCGVTFNTTGVVPEPSTWAMMAVGFVGLGFASYRASRKATAFAV